MALAKCRECGKQVSSEASKCPHCGISNPCPELATGIVCLIAFAIVGFWFFSGECRDSSDMKPASSKAVTYAPSRPSHSTLDAWISTQQFVEAKLLSPSAAKWPWVHSDDVAEHLGNGRYMVISYVDSENAFGARIRTRFNCIVQHINDDEWRLENLTFY
jgi:hypothetical protein